MNDETIYDADDRLEDALALQAAGISVEEILTGAGNDAEWLRPMLEMAAEVEGLQQALPIPPPDASLQRMLAYGKEIAIATPPETPAQSWWQINFSGLTWANWQVALSGGLLAVFVATGLLVGLLAGGLLGGGVILAAEDSLPGESLYPVKQLGESARLFFAGDSAKRQRLLEDFNRRRQQEAQQLVDTGRRVEVSFYGHIESATATEITIDGLTVQIIPDTIIVGQLAAGAHVRLQGVVRTSDGLVALTITVLTPAPPAPTPTATLTPPATRAPTRVKPTATEKPAGESTSDTIIIDPTFTPTATPTATATQVKPTPTTTPSPTATLTTTPIVPLITQTPGEASPEEDNNSNSSDDNANDNDNDNDSSDDHGNDNESDDSESDSSNSGKGGGDDDNSGSSNSGKGGGGDDKDKDD